MAFAESITEPPPTARISSIPCSLQIAIPSFTRLSRGFGLTPDNSYIVMPEAFREAVTVSYNPEALIEPPP